MTKQNKTATIPFDKALEEVEKWLDHKRVPQRSRDAQEEVVNQIAEAISDGYLILNDDHSFTHTLLIPLDDGEGKVTVEELTYIPRLNSIQLEAGMKGLSPSNPTDIVNGHIIALTGKPKGIIRKLDTMDIKLSRSIVTFFL